MPIIWCTSLVDLLGHVSQARMIIAEPVDSAGVPSAPTLALIRHRQPDTAFLAYIGLTAPSVRALRLMVLAGVTDVVIRDVDDAEVVLRQIVQRALMMARERTLLYQLAQSTPPLIQPFVAYCLKHGRSALTVVEVAEAVGVSVRTIADRLKRTGMPTPRTVSKWLRLYHVACLLDDRLLSVAKVANVLAFTKPAATYLLVRDLLKLSPAALRSCGAVSYTLAALVPALRPSTPNTN